MRTIKRAIRAVMLLCVSICAGAQTLQSEFFLDNAYYNYRINPAIGRTTSTNWWRTA